MPQSILAPAAALVCWSLVMLIWMAITRGIAAKKAGVNLATAPAGGRGNDLDGVLDAKAQWKAHNYTHLMEQPTIFYAAVFIIAMVHAEDKTTLYAAWAYVGLRILHSLWQAMVNTIPVRVTLFFLSSLCLIALAVHALLKTL